MGKYRFRVYLNGRTFDVTQEGHSPSDAQRLVEAQYNCQVICMGSL